MCGGARLICFISLSTPCAHRNLSHTTPVWQRLQKQSFHEKTQTECESDHSGLAYSAGIVSKCGRGCLLSSQVHCMQLDTPRQGH
jgi:hypothetical protein